MNQEPSKHEVKLLDQNEEPSMHEAKLLQTKEPSVHEAKLLWTKNLPCKKQNCNEWIVWMYWIWLQKQKKQTYDNLIGANKWLMIWHRTKVHWTVYVSTKTILNRTDGSEWAYVHQSTHWTNDTQELNRTEWNYYWAWIALEVLTSWSNVKWHESSLNSCMQTWNIQTQCYVLNVWYAFDRCIYCSNV